MRLRGDSRLPGRDGQTRVLGSRNYRSGSLEGRYNIDPHKVLHYIDCGAPEDVKVFDARELTLGLSA